MTATTFALRHLLASGRPDTAPRISRRARSLAAARALSDYWLLDASGAPLGTIPAARARPRLGTNAPTLYLRRPR